MNEEEFIPDSHRVDDLYRDAFDNYKEPPSDAAWSKLNHRLNVKEAVNFVTFKKAPASKFYKTPVYRMQWFRGLVAAGVSAAFVAGTFFLIERNHNEHNGQENHNANPAGTIIADQNQQTSHNSTPLNAQNYQVNPSSGQNTNPNTGNATNPGNGNKSGTHIVNGINSQNNNSRNNNPVNSIQTLSNLNNATTDYLARTNSAQSELLNQGNQGVVVNPNTDRTHRAEYSDSVYNAIIESSNDQYNNQDAGLNNGDASIVSPGTDPNLTGGNSKMLIPNAFTPNGDGTNDYFFWPDLERYPDNSIIILDRQNKTWLDKKGYTGDWNAMGAPDGTYSYVFRYIDEKGNTRYEKGSVQVIR
jgi:gliding motility-associated-like protein